VIAHLAVAMSIAAPPDHWFGSDKIKHFFIAAFTQSVTYSALQAARVRHGPALASAAAVTAAVSVAKELHDRRTTGLFSVRDLVWDAAGAGVASVLLHNAARTGAEDQTEANARLASARLVGSLLSSVSPGPILTPSIQPHWHRIR
jgi:putative lipoprotein